MIIYKATNRINGKAYIGQTIYTLENRKNCHISNAARQTNNNYFHNTIRKYGPENFKWEIIAEGKCSIETLNKLEIHFIQVYNTFEDGYNLTLGGGGMVGFKHSEESKLKISKANKGKNSPFYGKKRKPFSIKTKQKMSEAKKGKSRLPFSMKTKLRISKARKCQKDPYTKVVIIDNHYFNTLIESAKFIGITPSAIRYRILHKTKWVEYKYA